MDDALEKSARAPGSWATHAALPHIALVVVQLSFGSQAVEGKLAMMPRAQGGAGIAPLAIAMTRMLGAAIFFQALALVMARRTKAAGEVATPAPPALGVRDHAVLFGLSLLGITINQTLFLMGLHRTTPLSAALLCVTIPVFATALAVVAKQERASARFAIGLVFALSGAVGLTAGGQGAGQGSAIDRGALLVLLNSFSYALYLVLGRDVIRRVGAMTVIRWIFTWGAVSFLPIGLAPMKQAFAEMTLQGAALLGYIVVVPTIVAYLANAWALGRSGALLVTIYIYLQPLIAAVLAYVQLDQPLTLRALACGALILMGVTLASTRATKLRSSVSITSRRQ